MCMNVHTLLSLGSANPRARGPSRVSRPELGSAVSSLALWFMVSPIRCDDVCAVVYLFPWHTRECSGLESWRKSFPAQCRPTTRVSTAVACLASLWWSSAARQSALFEDWLPLAAAVASKPRQSCKTLCRRIYACSASLVRGVLHTRVALFRLEEYGHACLRVYYMLHSASSRR